MLKKPGTFSSPYSNISSLYCPKSISGHTATAPHSFPHSSKPPGAKKFHWRHYATTYLERLSQDRTDELFWPKLPYPGAIPTPYQILSARRGDPYSKRRFYELAKIYHPDKSIHEHNNAGVKSLPGAVKMERYRTVVAAHEILSDPIKRSAYDLSGAGWNGRPEVGAPEYYWGHNRGARWSGFDTNDSPFKNATWEDWEKWYQRDKAKQEPVYFSNGGFLILVITAVLLGGFGQSLRVGDYSDVFKNQVETIHDDASKGLKKRKIDSTGFENRDKRLQSFLRSRDPSVSGSTLTAAAEYCKPLPESEI